MLYGSKQIQTPTMDDLAASGVLLNSYYVSPSPFATRCEIMTGKYATKLGKKQEITFRVSQVKIIKVKDKLKQGASKSLYIRGNAGIPQ